MREEAFDMVVVGAGFGGIYAVHRLRQAGLSVLGIEGASGFGGTWYHNGYPGSRVDTDSVNLYSYTFSQEVYDEWRWKERYATQAELMDYANWVADKLDVRKLFRFESWLVDCRWSGEDRRWHLTIDGGARIACCFLVMCTGNLSIPKPVPFAVPLGVPAAKYTHASLAAFLRDPLQVRPSGRMPGLNLNEQDASDIAAYFLKGTKADPNLNYTYYEGKWERLPKFDQMKPLASGTSARTHTDDRSAMVSSGVEGSTAVPTVTPRVTTTPLRGATTVTRRLGSPLASIAATSSGDIPRTPRRVRPPATTALEIPDAATACRAARYSVWDESNSCENTRAKGWPARTVSPVVLTSSCSTHPATRVCTCEMRDSSGATVATA